MAQDFVTTYHHDYSAPFSRPLVARPCQPPGPDMSAPRGPRPVVPPYCHCDAHEYDPQLDQYKDLLIKEDQLCKDYFQLQRQIADVGNQVLDHPCGDDDTKLQSMYQISYKRKGFPVAEYRSIMAAAESHTAPVRRHRIGNLAEYKDPTEFSYVHSPTIRPTVEPAKDAHLAVLPQTVIGWFADFPGRTEYEDTISKVAKATWRSAQRYREPLPSARRREDDKCL